MTMKSLLLGAAAGIAAVSVAQAADLPMTKGEAVEYVKVCSAFGPGFFYIPGSDTCLQIKGEIRADYRGYGGGGSGRQAVTTAVGAAAPTTTTTSLSYKFGRNDNRTAFGTQGRIAFDARTQTEWGLLRSYFQINADGRTASTTGTGTTNKFAVDKAFIQFGGLTAGYAHSFFGFYDNDWGDTICASYYAESNTVNLLAYTWDFGGGLQATLSIEDGRSHNLDGFDHQGCQQIPDVVGQLRYDSDWGGVAVQAASHQYRSKDGVLSTGSGHADKWGYAAGASLLIKIPGIDGGHFVVEGQYANGALDYLGAGSTLLGNGDFYVSNTGSLRGGKGWSIVAELGGNITPSLAANLVGSYIDIKYDGIKAFAGKSSYNKEFTVAGNLTYTIVKGLTISGEVSYTRADYNIITDVTTTSAGTPAVITSAVTTEKATPNVWGVGVRLKRTF